MKINIIVKTNRREDRIEYIEAEDTYLIQTKEPNRDNRANLNLIDLISDYFNVSKTQFILNLDLSQRGKQLKLKKRNQDKPTPPSFRKVIFFLVLK